MIRLSSIIATFEAEFLVQYHDQLLPGHRRALHAMKYCRTVLSPKMQVQCLHCDQRLTRPAHRSGLDQP